MIVIHSTLEIGVHSCTDGSKNSQFSFVTCGVQQLCISPLGAQLTKMAANGSKKAFFMNVGQL
jgi:hypothetical protein